MYGHFLGRVRVRDGVDAFPADFDGIRRLVPALLVLVSDFRSIPCYTSIEGDGASLQGLGAQRLLRRFRDVRQVRLRVGRGGRRVEGHSTALS